MINRSLDLIGFWKQNGTFCLSHFAIASFALLLRAEIIMMMKFDDISVFNDTLNSLIKVPVLWNNTH